MIYKRRPDERTKFLFKKRKKKKRYQENISRREFKEIQTMPHGKQMRNCLKIEQILHVIQR